MALSENELIDVNQILELCGVSKLSPDEIRFLDVIDTVIATPCDMYKTVQSVVLERLSKTMCSGSALSRLKILAENAGCSLAKKEIVKRDIVMPIFGGGL